MLVRKPAVVLGRIVAICAVVTLALVASGLLRLPGWHCNEGKSIDYNTRRDRHSCGLGLIRCDAAWVHSRPRAL